MDEMLALTTNELHGFPTGTPLDRFAWAIAPDPDPPEIHRPAAVRDEVHS